MSGRASEESDLARGKAWAEARIEEAVREFIRRGISDSPALEAKPAWALPFNVVIGKIREQGDESTFFWAIGGEMPCDFIASSVAATPREAARHFALKWQLDAARQRESAGQEALAEDGRERAAESLYELVTDDRVWSNC